MHGRCKGGGCARQAEESPVTCLARRPVRSRSPRRSAPCSALASAVGARAELPFGLARSQHCQSFFSASAIPRRNVQARSWAPALGYPSPILSFGRITPTPTLPHDGGGVYLPHGAPGDHSLQRIGLESISDECYNNNYLLDFDEKPRIKAGYRIPLPVRCRPCFSAEIPLPEVSPNRTQHTDTLYVLDAEREHSRGWKAFFH